MDNYLTSLTAFSSDPFGSTSAVPPTSPESQVPGYVMAADNHNIGNYGESWLDYSPSNLPKFAAVSVLSGLNSFYNSAVTIGNFLGGDFEENKTDAWIGSLDSDLGKYYSENREAADLTGFLVTSLIPGTLGVKVLNAGQKALAAANSGFVGTNMGLALGLRTPAIESYIVKASKEIALGQAAFTSITGNTVKAVSLGLWQNVLEGAAFETAVQATMSASPILSEQSKSDVVWNIATGGLFGGALGGAFQTAKTFGSIKSGVKEFSAKINPFGSRGTYLETGNASDRLIFLADDLEHGPILNPGDPDYQIQVEKLQQRQTRIALDMRTAAHQLTVGDDKTLGNMIADFSHGQSADDILSTFLDTDQIGELNTTLKVESQIKEELKNTGVIPDHLQVQYYKLTGESAGKIIDSTPLVHNLADGILETSKKSTKEGVLQAVKDYRFSQNSYWDARNLTLATNTGHLEAEARFIWADHLAAPLGEEASIGAYDIPLLEKALKEGNTSIRLVDANGKVYQDGFKSQTDLQNYVVKAKKDVAYELQLGALKGKTNALNAGKNLEEAQDWVNEKIAKITNTKLSALEGTGLTGLDSEDYFAFQSLSKERAAYLESKGLKTVKGEENDMRFMPTWAKVSKVIRNKEDVDGNVIDGMTWIKTQQQLQRQHVDTIIANQVSEDQFKQLVPIKDRDLARADALGTGSGAVKFNNPEYDSLGSKVSLLGSWVQRTIKSVKDDFGKTSEGALTALARNQDAVIEWSTLNQKVSRSAKRWTHHEEVTEEGGINHYLVDLEAKQALKADEVLDISELGEDQVIPIVNKETADLVKVHQAQSSFIVNRRNERAAVMGADQAGTVGIFRAIPASAKDYPFIAFIKDPKVTSQGHTTMLFAQSEKELKGLADKAKLSRPDLDIYFKHDTEEFYKARQAYDYDRTLTDNYLDSSLKSEGIYSNYFTKTDPQAVLDEFTSHHSKLIDTDIREIVRTKYSDSFDWLEDQANSFSRVNTSRFGGSFEKLEAEGKNPYLSYIKTALNLSRTQESKLWYNINTVADKAVSKLVGNISDIWDGAKGQIGKEQLDSINASMQKYGMNTGYYDAATNLLVNHQPQNGYLGQFVRGANAILSRLTLALDPLNSVVNALGANILRSTELKQLTDAIKEGNTDIAGSLAHVDITGQGDYILSPMKLMASAVKDFVTKDIKDPLLQRYKDLGLVRSPSEQFKSMLDDLTVKGSENPKELQGRLSQAIGKANSLAEKGEKYTGNRLAEEFNRFVSARSIELLTQPAVDKGIITAEEQLAYMNTFVNRVEGNIIASQRPLAFQGPIGQAIGLFQSYQFNLMQQMFRYVAEGTAKDAAMLLGLQGTFFGIQGLPAFQAINQHIIGTASGNTQHRDAYDAIYGVAGKNLGDLLTYGLPSKILQTNLYSRGDINPRQVTVIPNSLEQVPIIGAFTKVFSNLKNTAVKIGGGANIWESLLQGLEHNGISRPLSGIAQTLQATTGDGVPFSTTTKGSIQFSNDLFSVATLSRLAGGRPLDEAIVNDGVFRVNSYAQYDLAKMNSLAEKVKASGIQGQEISNSQWQNFASQYAANGGKQVQFNKFMVREIKAANTSKAESITNDLKSPFSQKIQALMGESSPMPIPE